MTRSEALRALITAPRDHVDQGRIGRRVRWDRYEPIRAYRVHGRPRKCQAMADRILQRRSA